jgi:hypothetical protein
VKKLLVILILILLTVGVFATSGILAGPTNFVAHATGGEEVPPNNSRAQGQAIFRLSDDGTELYYKLIVANIQNVTMAHIHLAPAGVNGPVVVWLYPSAPPAQLIPGRSNGILAEGVITAANLAGPLAGATLDDLIEAMAGGSTYVNIHTSQFPPGEIRGQIRLAGQVR